MMSRHWGEDMGKIRPRAINRRCRCFESNPPLPLGLALLMHSIVLGAAGVSRKV